MAKLTSEEKAARVKKEKEEDKIRSIAFNLSKLRSGFYNKPTRFFKIGDRVDYGYCDTCIVEEVLDEGMIYYLKSTTTKKINSWDTKKVTLVDYSYQPWVSVLPYVSDEENETRPVLKQEEDVRLNFFQSPIDSLLHMYYGDYAGIDLDPDYQRGNVWGLEDKVSLIDSIFNFVDIGKFVFIRLPYKDHCKAYEVLDGKQRITALVEFYEDCFTYKGKLFSELSWTDRHHFTGYSFSRAETGADQISREQKYKYFLKLNVSGKPQDPDHIKMVKDLLKRERSKKLEE